MADIFHLLTLAFPAYSLLPVHSLPPSNLYLKWFCSPSQLHQHCPLFLPLHHCAAVILSITERASLVPATDLAGKCRVKATISGWQFRRMFKVWINPILNWSRIMDLNVIHFRNHDRQFHIETIHLLQSLFLLILQILGIAGVLIYFGCQNHEHLCYAAICVPTVPSLEKGTRVCTSCPSNGSPEQAWHKGELLNRKLNCTDHFCLFCSFAMHVFHMCSVQHGS